MLLHRANGVARIAQVASLARCAVVLVVAGCIEVEPETTIGGNRPVAVGVPAGYDEDRSYPLVVVLHGYGASGEVERMYLGAAATQSRGDAFVLAPDGLVDSTGHRFWNADGSCCDFDDTNPDDVAYIGRIVDRVIEDWSIDRSAIFAIGHANGANMAYRLACDNADTFAAIVALAGNTVTVPCEPARPISVLHVHGAADTLVPFARAESSVEVWASRNGCGGDLEADPTALDLDNAVPGADTTTYRTAGCPAEGAVDLWRIDGGSHVPAFTTAWEPAMWQWLQDHQR